MTVPAVDPIEHDGCCPIAGAAGCGCPADAPRLGNAGVEARARHVHPAAVGPRPAAPPPAWAARSTAVHALEPLRGELMACEGPEPRLAVALHREFARAEGPPATTCRACRGWSSMSPRSRTSCGRCARPGCSRSAATPSTTGSRARRGDPRARRRGRAGPAGPLTGLRNRRALDLRLAEDGRAHQPAVRGGAGRPRPLPGLARVPPVPASVGDDARSHAAVDRVLRAAAPPACAPRCAPPTCRAVRRRRVSSCRRRRWRARRCCGPRRRSRACPGTSCGRHDVGRGGPRPARRRPVRRAGRRRRRDVPGDAPRRQHGRHRCVGRRADRSRRAHRAAAPGHVAGGVRPRRGAARPAGDGRAGRPPPSGRSAQARRVMSTVTSSAAAVPPE